MKNSEILQSVVNSAEWAAYGDALGFITELASVSGVKWRLGKSKVSELSEWRRKIGGIYGQTVELSKGCYSDDTQLRLATARAISSGGYFDVESFAKVELPIWLSYALGAGRGTKSAAANLARRDTNWFSNFFGTKNSDYISGGGNGAAMRIQPHVWSKALSLDENEIVVDVIRNSITTHGHPHGFIGAVFHALCLKYVFLNGRVPSPEAWLVMSDRFSIIPNIIRNDFELGPFWLPTWEKKTGLTIEEAVSKFTEEFRSDVKLASSIVSEDSIPVGVKYKKLLDCLGGVNPKTRGSGSITSLIAVSASWLFRNESPYDLMVLVANSLDSDTDTIATLAGAISGAASKEEPPEEVLDRVYIREQAYNLVLASDNKKKRSFTYPDLATWKVPKSQSSAFVLIEGREAIAGLGYVTPVSSVMPDRRNSKLGVQWVKFDFGQTILVKRNLELKEVKNKDLFSEYSDQPIKPKSREDGSTENDDEDVSDIDAEKIDIDILSSLAIKSGFDEAMIGNHLLLIADKKNSIELSIAYAAVIAKARISRNMHSKK